jgi:transcriptional regulator with XRE-family HTH domain
VNAFGERIRSRREALAAEDPRYGLRKLAERLGVSPSWLSGLETGKATGKASEEVITKLAAELGENPDVLLALAGKVSSRLLEIITKRPEIFASVLEELDQLPDHAIVRVVREVRDGEW